MKAQLQAIEIFIVIAGITLMVGIMISIYASSVSSISSLGERRAKERSITEFCVYFPAETVGNTDKTLGELLAVYNMSGNEIFVIDGKYELNLTSYVEKVLNNSFGNRWMFQFGYMNIGRRAPASSYGCKIYIPSIDGKIRYAILKVW